MKQLSIFCLTLCFLMLSNARSFAVVAPQHQHARPTASKKTDTHTAKLSWWKKWLLKSWQKKMQRTAAPSAKSKRGLLSLIFGSLAFLLLWTPAAIISLPLCIAGLILGIIGLKRDANNTMAIIGVVMSGLTALIFIAALLTVLTWAWY